MTDKDNRISFGTRAIMTLGKTKVKIYIIIGLSVVFAIITLFLLIVNIAETSTSVIVGALGSDNDKIDISDGIASVESIYVDILKQYEIEYNVEEYHLYLISILNFCSSTTNNVGDVMMASDKLPVGSQIITIPEESINVGVKTFAQYLEKAKCKSVNDKKHLMIAVEAYGLGKYGNEYIENIIKQGDEYSSEKVKSYITSATNITTAMADFADNICNASSVIYSYPLNLPLVSTMTSDFAIRTLYGQTKKHTAVDFGRPYGDPVYSTVAGKVISVVYCPHNYGKDLRYSYTPCCANGWEGTCVVVLGNDGKKYKYLHLQKTFVKAGDIVISGQQIGEVGSTGCSTGAHLHYEVQSQIKNQATGVVTWESIDPYIIINAISRGDVKTTEETFDRVYTR